MKWELEISRISIMMKQENLQHKIYFWFCVIAVGKLEMRGAKILIRKPKDRRLLMRIMSG
jgi:hypothetical protein